MNVLRKDSVWFLFALFLAFVTPALSGTTGKLTGKVVEKGTREPLIGVNIFVEGTTIGNPTDVNGSFTILNVPPGIYKIRASIVGYAPVAMNDVRVYIDQTTAINFEMEVQAVTTTEVVIVAPREIVKKDVSTSVTSFSDEEVRGLPISNTTDIVGLQAGVESGLVIRGGGADQSLFLLDGVTLRDPRNNQPITGVPMSAVSDISVERGGFNAEYGQLRAGIINVVTKEGNRSKYNGTFTVRYSPPSRKYFGLSPFDPNSYWLRPFLDPSVAFSGTQSGGWDSLTQTQFPKFIGWNSISKKLAQQGLFYSASTLQRIFEWEHRKVEDPKQPDYNIDAGFGGPVPFVGDLLGNLRFYLSYRNERDMLLVPLSRPDYYQDNWSLRLTSDLSSSDKLNITGTMGRNFYVVSQLIQEAQAPTLTASTQYIQSPEQIAGEISGLSQGNYGAGEGVLFSNAYNDLAYVDNYSVSAQYTHVLNSKTFYELQLERVQRKYDIEAPGLRAVSTFELPGAPGVFVNEFPFGGNPTGANQTWADIQVGNINGMAGFIDGHAASAYDQSRAAATTIKGNLSSQFDAYNEFKAGFEVVTNDLHLEYGIKSQQYSYNDNYQNQHYSPFRGATYIQDKLEFEGFIANLGLRLDYTNANVTWWTVGPFDQAFYTQFDSSTAYPKEKSKGQWALSPRLGISHPITESSKLYFNYGHFQQLPSYEQSLRYARGATATLTSLGNPNLLMSSTTAYELGYDQSFLDEYLVQIAGFYRDISDQQVWTRFTSNKSASFQYVEPTNNGYQDVMGVELTLRRNAGTWVTGFVNYTYQVTTSGGFNGGLDPTGLGNIYQVNSDQLAYNAQTNNFYQSRPIPTPYARMNLSFLTPSDFEQGGVKQSLLGGWMVTVLADWRAGGFTTVPAISPNSINTIPVVDYYNANLRISKEFDIRSFKITLFADIQNLLNTERLNLNSFADATDGIAYFKSLHFPASDEYDNIPGSDKVGSYRADGVAWQPIVPVGSVASVTGSPDPKTIYYDRSSGKYMNFVNNAWSEVPSSRMTPLLDDKAYIDMPDLSSFWFLNPRNVFFGIRTSFEF